MWVEDGIGMVLHPFHVDIFHLLSGIKLDMVMNYLLKHVWLHSLGIMMSSSNLWYNKVFESHKKSSWFLGVHNLVSLMLC